MDTLDPRTLYKLHRYVVRNEPLTRLLPSKRGGAETARREAQAAAVSSGTKKKRTREVLSEAQATRKIKEIEDKLGLYSGNPPVQPPLQQQDSGALSVTDASDGSDSDGESEVSDASDD